MAFFDTNNFGRLDYDPASAIEFPRGIPGFEDRRKFLALEFDNSRPLVFLQSLEDPALCFITAPVLSVDPAYRLCVSAEDLTQVDLNPDAQPRIGSDVLCLAVLSIEETATTANLLGPVVVNIRNLKAVQAIAQDTNYSHQFLLAPAAEAASVCS
jgi:flagellar assembly factor FliW